MSIKTTINGSNFTTALRLFNALFLIIAFMAGIVWFMNHFKGQDLDFKDIHLSMGSSPETAIVAFGEPYSDEVRDSNKLSTRSIVYYKKYDGETSCWRIRLEYTNSKLSDWAVSNDRADACEAVEELERAKRIIDATRALIASRNGVTK